MEAILKRFLTQVSPRDTRELVQDHVKKLELSPAKDTLTLHVDKRYAFHAIISHDHIERIIRCVKKSFGKSVTTVVQLDKNSGNRLREKAVPHAVHYR
jgi:acetylornithine deacetylase/succinyl-diaminopimelate desuccinylase-like protein